MKFKKFVTFALTAVFAGALFTGCGQDANKPQAVDNSTLKLGMITRLNVSEQKMNDIMKKIEEESDVKLAHQITVYDDLNSLTMGLKSKSVDEISVYDCVGNYMVAKDPEIEIAHDKTPKLTDSFCCAVREEDSELKNSVDNAIQEMKNDGTLEKLVKTYITDLKGEPPAVEIEKIDGADTIKVGVTGDLPPLDLILANGSPAGFNTAVLSEISKRINKNIELIQINSAARAAALTSKKVDVVFWVVVPQDDKRPADMDKPAGIETTTPYFQDDVVHLTLKK